MEMNYLFHHWGPRSVEWALISFAQEPLSGLEVVCVRSDLICSWPDSSASINLP